MHLLRPAINRHTKYTANKVMLVREGSVNATFLYRPPESIEFKKLEEVKVDKYMRDLQEKL